MEMLVEVARTLRQEHRFGGYIHLKTIPDASPELLSAAARWADRLSINVEMPTEGGLKSLAPEKNLRDIRQAMGRLRLGIDEAKAEKKAPRFAPAGQSTQMIVGADASTDRDVLTSSTNLYANYRLKRVYYSAFSPIPDASKALPLRPPPLVREHRLYQADWLLRFYGFNVEEIAPAGDTAMLDPGYRSQDGLGAAPSRAVSRRSQHGAQGDIATGAGTGRAHSGQAAFHARASAPALR